MRNNRTDVTIYVEELILIESGTYNDQHLRPYVTEVSGSLMDQVEERYSKSRRFTPAMLSSIANQFMVPDYHTRGVIEIPHGWSTRRGRFILTVELKIGTGDKLRQVIMGYTNHVGFTTRNVDPDLEFYVNSTFMLSEQTVRTASGYRRVWMPTGTNDVLSDRENAGLRRRSEELFTMRPEDVYSAIDAEQTHELVDDVTDLRTTLSKAAVKSRTSNRISSRFMGRVLNSRQKAIENAEYGGSVLDINASAQGYAAESYATDDLFLRRISAIKGSNLTVDNFTFGDLERLDPDADDRTETMLLDNEARAITAYDNDTRQLGGQEEEDQVAALIGIAVPALMVECGLAEISFQVHNQRGRDDFEFLPNSAHTFMKDTDVDSFADKFEERMIDELLLPITLGSDVEIGIQLTCRAFGEVNFTLFYAGVNHGRFVYPCFTNSLASPIVTNSRDDVRKMSKNFNDLFSHFLPTDLAGEASSNGRDFNY